ncbi:anaerobic sulfatase maturase [Planctomycetota bacterium]
MSVRSRGFQIFAKPVGSQCNLACGYCYYLPKESLHPQGTSFRMSEDLLETYIVQHIEACTDSVIHFSWHGGEPMLLGMDCFRTIVALQYKHRPADKVITNGIQTNGTLVNDEWCCFFAQEAFTVGLSMDGPEAMHDRFRVGREGEPTHARVREAYHRLKKYGITTESLCVVHAYNARYAKEVYDFFRQLEIRYLTFLPLVEAQVNSETGVSERSVPAEAWGEFLCTVFDAWQARDIGRMKIQIFEEAARTAFDQEHILCIFRKTCGAVPVLERNGDMYSCDHFVMPENRLGNILDTTVKAMLDSPAQQAFGQAKWDTLPRPCRDCDVLTMCHGGCPKNRFVRTAEGEPGLNYLCPGYYRFFSHCRPFINTLAKVYRDRSAED